METVALIGKFVVVIVDRILVAEELTAVEKLIVVEDVAVEGVAVKDFAVKVVAVKDVAVVMVVLGEIKDRVKFATPPVPSETANAPPNSIGRVRPLWILLTIGQ